MSLILLDVRLLRGAILTLGFTSVATVVVDLSTAGVERGFIGETRATFDTVGTVELNFEVDFVTVVLKKKKITEFAIEIVVKIEYFVFYRKLIIY
jgi:hypothetical protein